MAFSSNGSLVSCASQSGVPDYSKYELAIILVAILPIATIALVAFILIKYVSYRQCRGYCCEKPICPYRTLHLKSPDSHHIICQPCSP